ncbi:MAG: hypothetical protein ACRCVU_11795 [Flavobacterium sp.]
MSKEEILQAILDKKQLQEWDGLAEKFFNITDQQALSNIVHGKVCTMRTKPIFGYMHFHESELYKMIEKEIDRPENTRHMEELEQEFREMFDRAIDVFFGKGAK